MYGKIKIKAVLEVLTGLHIGGSGAYSAIGAVNSPVIRDARSGRPIIPGSSLKGKLRTLLARSIADSVVPNAGPDEDTKEIKRLFGGDKGKVKSRLQFVDAFLLNNDELKETGVTEVKSENAISRTSGKANPRHIERVVRGSRFDFVIIYDVEDKAQIREDFLNLARALKLLAMDYLGGHGTRGYGRVRFKDFVLERIESALTTEDIAEYTNILKDVEGYELLSL